MTYYFIDQHGTPISAMTFASTDEAYDFCEQQWGADAFNVTAILAAYE